MSRFSRRSLMKSYDQRTGRRVPGATLVEDGEKTGLLVRRGEDDPPHPLSQPFVPPPDRTMLLGSRAFDDPPNGNLLTVTEGNFTASPWTATAVTQTQNAAYAPNGTLTATRLLETATNSTHDIWGRGITITSGATYTVSFS